MLSSKADVLRPQSRAFAAPRASPRARLASLTHAWSFLVGGLAGPFKRMSALATDKWWSDQSVAVVTGANKGIGFEIAKIFRAQGLTTVVTSRDEQLGLAAFQKVSSVEGPGSVLYHQLDISDPKSVAAFAAWTSEKFPGGIDILVNNAGFAYKGDVFGADECQATMDINFLGTMNVTNALLPLIKDGTGRVVNVSSRAGLLSRIPDAGRRASIAGAASPDELVKLMDAFVAAIRNGTHPQEGWSNSMYGTSKLLLSMYTRLAAKDLAPRKIMVNCCCPGWCQTDMSSGRGNNTAAEGADTPCWLALRSPSDFVTGKLFGERTELEY